MISVVGKHFLTSDELLLIFSRSKMEWNDDLSLKLIQLYRDNPILWDPNDKNFKLPKWKIDIWRGIADEFGCEVTEVKKKMESLLSSYRREWRRIRSARSGTGEKSVYHSRWFAFKEMQFLNDKLRPRKTQNTLNVEVEGENLDTDSKSEDNEYSQPILSIPSPTSYQPASPDFQSTAKRFKSSMDLVETGEACTLLNKAVFCHEVEDECDLYVKILVKRLRQLPEWERQVIMHEVDGMVLNAMHHYRFGSSSSPSSLTYSSRHASKPTSSFSTQNQTYQHNGDEDTEHIIKLEDERMLS